MYSLLSLDLLLIVYEYFMQYDASRCLTSKVSLHLRQNLCKSVKMHREKEGDRNSQAFQGSQRTRKQNAPPQTQTMHERCRGEILRQLILI